MSFWNQIHVLNMNVFYKYLWIPTSTIYKRSVQTIIMHHISIILLEKNIIINNRIFTKITLLFTSFHKILLFSKLIANLFETTKASYCHTEKIEKWKLSSYQRVLKLKQIYPYIQSMEILKVCYISTAVCVGHHAINCCS